MAKVLIATEKAFAPAAVADIKKIVEEGGNEFALLEKYTDARQLLEAVKDADAMIVRSDKITPAVLDAAKKLKIIVRAGAGYDSIDTAYAKEKGVVVENTPGQNANAVAELVFGMLVYMARNGYNGKSGTELKGKTLGILAFGNVGRNVARIGKGFDMNIYAYDEFVPSEKIEAAGVRAVTSRDELFRISDVLSLHIPATAETVKSINYDVVKLLPKGAILVNAARKEVIDEEGLLRLMRERTDLKYIADIKPDLDAEFQKLPGQYFATPKKMGAQTAEANINAGIAAAKQINSFFATGDERFRVNR